MIEKCSGGPTKPEIITLSLSKLQLQPTDTMADIGCGSGAVTITAAGQVQHVYAIDHRSLAINTTRKNLEHHHIRNVTLIHAEATQALTSLNTSIDCAFIGGTEHIEQTINTAIEKGATRVVINAVRIETACRTLQHLRQLNMFQEALHVSISRSHTLKDEIMFKPDNPVYILIGQRRDATC